MEILKEERLIILDMLKDEKIKGDEAIDLLDAIRNTSYDYDSNEDLSEERSKILDMVYNGKLSSREASDILKVLRPNSSYLNKNLEINEIDITNKFNSFIGSLENIGKEISDKATVMLKRNEPRVKKIVKTLVEKSAKAADAVSKSLNETLKNMEAETVKNIENENNFE